MAGASRVARKGVEGMGLGLAVRRSEGKYGQASKERRYWGREAGK